MRESRLGTGSNTEAITAATVVRMLLVPAVMHLLRDRNWWLPGWLDRLLPEVHIKGDPQQYQPSIPGGPGQPVAAVHQLAGV